MIYSMEFFNFYISFVSCDSQATCVNNNGSFTCTGNVGFTGNGATLGMHCLTILEDVAKCFIA